MPVPCQSEQGRVPEAVAIGRLRCKGVERDKGEGPKVPADVDRLQCQVARGDIDRPRGVFAAKAIQYMLKRWPAFTLFLDDGRVCMSNNAAERA